MNRTTYPYLMKGILAGALLFIVEYLAFSFLHNPILLSLLVILVLLAAYHILLEITMRYKACLTATLVSLVGFGIFSYIVMNTNDLAERTYSWMVRLLFALSWFIPYLYCFFRQYLDRGPRFPDYNKYFYGMTIIFFIPFTICFVYLNYINPSFFHIYQPKNFMYIPFYMTATYIENITNHSIDGFSLIVYITMYVLLFLPVGYHGRLFARDLVIPIRFIILLGLCLVAEVIKIPLLGTFNIDNILYSFIGVLLGSALFALVDYKHYQRKDTEYLHKTSFNFTYRY